MKEKSLKNLAILVSEKFKEHHLECILVGGACVTIYSQNRYQSYDLDYVTYEDRSKIKSTLKELGFVQKGRYFYHPDSAFFIEFVTPPVSVGKETIKNYNYLGAITLLSPTDCVKDRLASFYYWNDRQALEQATMVCKAQKNV